MNANHETAETTLFDTLLIKSFEKYKQDWCNARGYDITRIDEEIGINGECYVCLDEFEINEFQDKDYICTLLDADEYEHYKILFGKE